MPKRTPIFFHGGNRFSLDRRALLKAFISKMMIVERRKIEEIHFYCMDDKEMRAMNKKLLSHDYPTDTITLPYASSPILADIFLGGERIRENARTYGSSIRDEWARVIFHSVLHILGYDDKTDRQAAEMRRLEDEWIKMFHVEQKKVFGQKR